LILGAGPAWALPDSSFEGGDGNLEYDTLADWGELNGDAALLIGVDEPPGQSDDSLKGKEDEDVPEIVVGSIPKNKSDLLRFYVHHEKVDADGGVKDFLHLAWVRANTLGTANMDFEFNQSRDLTANGSTPVRVVDDMLITFAFASGGSEVILGLSRWTESGPCEAAASAPCWGPVMPLVGIAEGAVNLADAYDPIEGVSLTALTFGEASVNLTDAGIFDRDDCVSFGSAYVKSRSSASFTASLKDFIRPIDVSVSNCAIVTVTKDAVPDDTQAFGFDASPGLGSASFSLEDDGDESDGESRTKMFMVREEGLYWVTENPSEGWDLTDVVCTGGGTPQVDATDAITGTATLDLTIGETTSCTFTNTKRGRILIDQVSVPGGDPQSFDFHLSAISAPESVSQEFRLADPDPLHDSGRVRPGLYSVAQLYQGAGWDLTGASCDDGSSVDSIELEPGEVVTCTFVNTKRGGIVVDVRTEPTGHEQSFDLALIGGPSNLNLEFGLADQTTPYFAGSLLPGSGYAISQSPLDGWFTSSAGCDDGSPVGNVDVAPGEIVTCTFVNARMGRITIDKATDPAGDLAGFGFALNGGPSAVAQSFSLADESAPHDSGFLLPGAGYTIEELASDEDWDLTNIHCESAVGTSTVTLGGADPDPGYQDGDRIAGIELGIDDEVRCTFTNTKRGTIVIIKDAIPSHVQDFDFTISGPDSFISFSLDDDGDATDNPSQGLLPRSASFARLTPGAYTAAQADPGPAWDPTGLRCTDSNGSSVGSTDLQQRTASFELPPGETITCVFTDTARGTIVVEKFVVNEPVAGIAYNPHDVLFEFSPSYGPSFWLSHGETNESPLLPGGSSQSISEHSQPGWQSSSSCSYPDGSTGSAGNVTVIPGGTVHCLFTNELKLHPGSSGFWRNWRNHYVEDELTGVMAYAFVDSGVYDDLFDEEGALIPEAVEVLDDIYDQSSGTTHEEQQVLRELTTAKLNLAVSKSPDPEIRALQRNDDVCLDCIVDLSGIPDAEELIRALHPGLIFGDLTVRDVVDTVEAQWDGSLVPQNWSFGLLTSAELSLLAKILEGINQGDVLIVDLTTMPDNPSCVVLPGLPDGTAGMSYSETIPVSGGISPYRWRLIDPLPPGLNLIPWTGELFGVPTLASLIPKTYIFRVMVVDQSAVEKKTTRLFSITINPPPQIATVSVPDGFMEQPYHESLEVSGGSDPIGWVIVDGELPEGLALNSISGVISGTAPMARPAKSSTTFFTVEVIDANSATDTEYFSLTVHPTQDSVCDPAPPTPSGSSELILGKYNGELMLFWTPVDGATAYDVVLGDLTHLRNSAGDFSSSTASCLAYHENRTGLTVSGADPGPGQASWYLVRGLNCGGDGTYDSDPPMQPFSRDAGIAAASDGCP
jgi:hypothetical protein